VSLQTRYGLLDHDDEWTYYMRSTNKSKKEEKKNKNLKYPHSSRSKRQQKKSVFKGIIVSNFDCYDLQSIFYSLCFFEAFFFLPKNNSINKLQVATQS